MNKYMMDDEDLRPIYEQIMSKRLKEMTVAEKKIYKFFKKKEEVENIEIDKLRKPTLITISTKSIKAVLTHQLDLGNLMSKLVDVFNEENGPVCGIDYGDIILGKKVIKKKKKKKRFYNQGTVIVKLLNNRYVNMKFFLNKSISMTGCLEDDDGLKAINIILGYCLNFGEDVFMDKENIEDVRSVDYYITLINADYEVSFRIDKIKLFELLTRGYGLYADCPEKYPAVKINYLWNEKNKIQKGICECDEKCQFTKNRRKTNSCKIVMIAIFHTGKIIITGASNMEQTKSAYNYINKILYENYKKIVKISIS